jgi:hypothetical protein
MTDDHLIHHARQLDEQLSIAFAEIEALTAQLADYTHRGDDVHPVEAAMRDHDEGMTGWQPIETAPKDGTFILGAYFYNGHEPDYSIVRWNKKDWLGYCDGDRSILSQGDTYTDYHEPFCTHWMPLPAAPTEGK